MAIVPDNPEGTDHPNTGSNPVLDTSLNLSGFQIKSVHNKPRVRGEKQREDDKGKLSTKPLPDGVVNRKFT